MEHTNSEASAPELAGLNWISEVFLEMKKIPIGHLSFIANGVREKSKQMSNTRFGKKLKRMQRSEVNPTPPEQSYCSSAGPKVEGMDSFGQPQFNGSEDVVSVPIEKGGGNNPQQPPPNTCTARIQAA